MNDKLPESFWLTNPAALFSTLSFLPTRKMTNPERLNALTRLLLIIVAVMFAIGNEHTLTVLVLGLLLIIVLRSYHQREHFGPHRGQHDPCRTCGQDSSMAYINSKYEETPQNQFTHIMGNPRSYTGAKYTVKPIYVPAPYREVWRHDAKYCSEFSQYPDSYTVSPNPNSGFNQPTNRCHYDDREWVLNTPNNAVPKNLVSAMPAVQSAFMRDSSEFRNAIMGDIVDQFSRWRQHNCVDFKPGRKTF